MKKKVFVLLAAATLTLGALSGCGSKTEANDNNNNTPAQGTEAESKTELEKIVVGASPTPHAEILNAVKDELAKEGYELEVVEYNDYVLPNTSTEDGELDANFFQHEPYLKDFNAENGTHLVTAAYIHFEPFGIYAGKTSDLKELKDGAKVLVPNDTTNEARALLLLQQEGLIKLKEGVGLQATKLDIEENPLNLEIIESEAAQVARAVQDVDIACVNGNYALGAGLSDPIAVESVESEAAQTYANIVCVKEGNEDSPKTKALVKALTSDTAKKFIESKYGNSVIPVF